MKTRNDMLTAHELTPEAEEILQKYRNQNEDTVSDIIISMEWLLVGLRGQVTAFEKVYFEKSKPKSK